MADPIEVPPPGFDELSIDEKLEYVQALWDRIAADVDAVPLSDWHRAVLETRIKEHDADPGGAVPWDAVYERLQRN